jgi:predicted O-methyltransferase YrrM
VDSRYWSRAVGSFLKHLRHKDFVKEIVTAGLRADAAPKAVPIPVFKLFPKAKFEMVPMGDMRYRIYNMDPMEQYCLAVIAQLRQPTNVFEIGTFDGATSLLLARIAPGATVYTLDLPPETVQAADDSLTAALNRVDGEGSRFRDTPEAARIVQLYGDSRTFDFRPYYGKMDLVIVDGGHASDCVIPDTENAFAMLAPGGIVVWDDYTPHWPNVVAAVDAAAGRRGLSLHRILSTEFAVYDSSRSSGSTAGLAASAAH